MIARILFRLGEGFDQAASVATRLGDLVTDLTRPGGLATAARVEELEDRLAELEAKHFVLTSQVASRPGRPPAQRGGLSAVPTPPPSTDPEAVALAARISARLDEASGGGQ